jgi:hypothetical protein
MSKSIFPLGMGTKLVSVYSVLKILLPITEILKDSIVKEALTSTIP